MNGSLNSSPFHGDTLILLLHQEAACPLSKQIIMNKVCCVKPKERNTKVSLVISAVYFLSTWQDFHAILFGKSNQAAGQTPVIPAGRRLHERPGGSTLSSTGNMAVCQSLATTTQSSPGLKGKAVRASMAALLNSTKRFWLSE